jgi:hypothetical protein
VARATYWLRVMFWEEFKAESLDPKLLVLVILSTCFASSVIPLFTTPLLTQFFWSCSALIVLPLSLFWSSVIVRRAELKARSQLQLVEGMVSVYTLVHRNIIELHETPRNPMEPHGISWNLMESHGTSLNPTEPHGISWKVLKHGGIIWLLTNDYK